VVVREELEIEEDKDLGQIELVLARLLRAGSLIAAALLTAGIIVMALGNAILAPKLMTAGLLVLLGTPIMRVLVAGYIFVKHRDWHFACFSLVVLCALAAGIYLGAA
jgi:uncharacterized membrane protein